MSGDENPFNTLIRFYYRYIDDLIFIVDPDLEGINVGLSEQE